MSLARSPEGFVPFSTDATMSIGTVVSKLRAEFPALSVSKVRFLEDQGVVTPARTGSGYRKFSDNDIARLRYCLIQQRDNYKPLKIIVDELEKLEQGFDLQDPQGPRVVSVDGKVVLPARTDGTVTFTELRDLTGAPQEVIEQLISAKIIALGVSGRFSSHSLDVVKATLALQEAGLDVRNLRQVVAAANRAKTLISQVSQGDDASRSEIGRELGNHILTLISHTLLETSS